VDVAGTAYAAPGAGDGGGCGGGGDDFGLNLLVVRGTFGIWNNWSLRPLGFAPAFGRAVAPSARLFTACVNACPSVLAVH
jgi:hypothetical protein